MAIFLLIEGKDNAGGTAVRRTNSSFFSIPLCRKVMLLLLRLTVSLFLGEPSKC